MALDGEASDQVNTLPWVCPGIGRIQRVCAKEQNLYAGLEARPRVSLHVAEGRGPKTPVLDVDAHAISEFVAATLAEIDQV